MNITPINNHQQNFKALNIENLSAENKRLLRGYEFDRLKDIGNRFDIKLTSIYEGIKGFEAIEIEVKPLRDNMNFFKKILRPTGRSTSKVDENSSIIEAANEAIANLLKKM